MKSTDLNAVSDLLKQRAALKEQIAALGNPGEADVTVTFDVECRPLSYDDADMQRVVASTVSHELARRLGKIDGKLSALGVQTSDEPEPVNDDVVVEQPSCVGGAYPSGVQWHPIPSLRGVDFCEVQIDLAGGLRRFRGL